MDKPQDGNPVPVRITEADDAGTSSWLVDPAGSEGALKTIAEAIEKAPPGTVIEIRPGIYREQLKLRKSLTLRGLTGPDGTRARIESHGSDTVTIIDGEVTLENLQVALFAPENARSPGALLQLGGTLLLRDSVISAVGNHPAAAFSLRAGSAKLVGCEFSGLRGIEQYAGKLDCRSCSSSRCAGSGVFINNAGGDKELSSVFRELSAIGNEAQGVCVYEGAKVSLFDCRINANLGNGVDLFNDGSAIFVGCELNENFWNGLVGSGTSSCVFSDGRVVGNKLNGLSVMGSASLTLGGNRIAENGVHGYGSYESATVKDEGTNSIVANRGGPVYKARPLPAATAGAGSKKPKAA